MPHAVILDATKMADIGQAPIHKKGPLIHKVLEVAESDKGWLLKCLIAGTPDPVKFLARVDRREDGLVVHIDDHMQVERSPDVFEHLAAIAQRILAANPGARLGKTNLKTQLAAVAAPSS